MRINNFNDRFHDMRCPLFWMIIASNTSSENTMIYMLLDALSDLFHSDGYQCDAHGNHCSASSTSVDLDLFSQSLADGCCESSTTEMLQSRWSFKMYCGCTITSVIHSFKDELLKLLNKESYDQIIAFVPLQYQDMEPVSGICCVLKSISLSSPRLIVFLCLDIHQLHQRCWIFYTKS